jgi:hypothetical protein
MPARLDSSTTTRNLACQMAVAGSEVVAEEDAEASTCVSGMLTELYGSCGWVRQATRGLLSDLPCGTVRRPAPYRASWV